MQQIETIARLLLRFRIELPLKLPDLLSVFQAHVIPHLGSFGQLVRSKGPLLHRHYPASPLLWPSPRPKPADTLSAPFGLAPLAPGFPLLPGLPSPHAVPTTPADRIGACRFLLVRSRTGFFPIRAGLPGAHNRSASTDLCFEACSGFIRITAYRFARPPYVDFVTRLQPEWFPIRTARQLPRHIDSSWRGTFTHW
jgi:hypothetical protein